LFRSYCFVHLEEKERALVFDTPGVVRYLFWDKKPAIVRQQEIDVIKNLLNDFDHATIEALTFAPDDKIIIESGAFSSQEAQVTATQGKQIIVKIESLGMFISIDTTKNKVKKIV
jgi:transcriptional antiterminator RfaH